jgi:hypothetical protein
LFSCSKDDKVIDNVEKPIDFYACGGATSGSFDERAVYWKNGQPTFLSNQFSYANAIEVLDDNVHVIGDDNGVSKYWVNGIAQQYSTMAGYSLLDICTDGNDVYIVGSNYNSIKYWKNGVQFDVINSGTSVYAAGIKVVGSDVYIAYKENGEIKTWKNGVITNLSNGTTNEDLKNMDVYNADIYVLADNYNSGVKKIKYWKNGVANYLTSTGNNIVSYHIKVNQNGVVIGGTYNNKGGYWKNDVFFDLSTTGVNSYNYATNILDNDVFNVISENGKAKFFKNTTLLYTDSSISNANLNDCKVIYK